MYNSDPYPAFSEKLPGIASVTKPINYNWQDKGIGALVGILTY